MRTHFLQFVPVLFLLAGCGSVTLDVCDEAAEDDAGAPVVAAAEPDAGTITPPSELDLCSLDRDPYFPCTLLDGTELFDGECCVESGEFGYCVQGYTVDSGPLLWPVCRIP
jgi:hypothetical protein